MNNKEQFVNNKWLVSDLFLSRVQFDDMYYFRTLGKYLFNFLKYVPINVLSTWDSKYKRIFFFVGKNKKAFKVDTNIWYSDFIYIVESYLKQFYPQYEIDAEIESSLSEKEMFDMIQKGMNPNDVLDLTKKEHIKETGIITKMFLTKDLFVLDINNKKELRMAGTVVHLCSLSYFKDNLKLIKGGVERRKYIYEYSSKCKDLNTNTNVRKINLKDKQLFSFIKTRLNELQNNELVQLSEYTYSWGKYQFTFNSETLKQDIFNFLACHHIHPVQK